MSHEVTHNKDIHMVVTLGRVVDVRNVDFKVCLSHYLEHSIKCQCNDVIVYPNKMNINVHLVCSRIFVDIEGSRID